jgi:hypothetical protein
MTKEGYLKLLGQLLREHYGIIRETGIASPEKQHYIDGYLTAARTLNAIYQKELTDFIERVHFEMFGMTIEERHKASAAKPEISEDELDIPTYRRRGIKLNF